MYSGVFTHDFIVQRHDWFLLLHLSVYLTIYNASYYKGKYVYIYSLKSKFLLYHVAYYPKK